MSNDPAAGVSWLVLTQAFTKIATFSLNQLLVQFVTPSVLGSASHWEFVVQTVLFFSREAERLAVQRADSESHEAEVASKNKNNQGSGDSAQKRAASSTQMVVNFGHVPLAIGTILTAAVVMWYRNSLAAPLLILISLLIVLELLAEPMFSLNQYQLGFRKRSRIESIAVVARCVTTFCGVVGSQYWGNSTNGGAFGATEGAVAAYLAGQTVYAAVVYGCYHDLKHRIRPIGAADTVLDRYLAPHLFSVWRGLFVQMLFKHMLTEGDRLLISWLCSPTEQGVYALVTNYGSIMARVLFQPVEELLRLVLAKELAASNTLQTRKAAATMQYILMAYFHLSVLMVLGGFGNGAYVLQFALGRSKALVWRATNVFTVFPQYILYLPFLAFNGVLEAFFSSAASESQIQRFSWFMLALTVVVLLLLYWLIEVHSWGLQGLMVANGANMTLRIAYCASFMGSFLKARGIETSVLRCIMRIKLGLFLAPVLGLLQHAIAEGMSIYGFPKLALGCVTCLVYAGVIGFSERRLLTGLGKLRKRE